MKPLSTRFHSKVDRSGGQDSCWPWTASCVKGGYGQIGKGPKGAGCFMSHRLAWILEYGPIPNDLQVLHKCDNKKCCNPRHLFLGTQLDNIRDMISKGRKAPGPDARGENSAVAKLTWNQVREIRRLYNTTKIKQVELAKQFNLSQSQISAILTNKCWVE